MKRFVSCATFATLVAALAVSVQAQATDPSPPLADLSMEAPYAPIDTVTFCEAHGLTPAILTEHVLVLTDLTGDRVDRDVGWAATSATHSFFVRTVDMTTTSSSIGADRQRDTGEKRGGALRAHPT